MKHALAVFFAVALLSVSLFAAAAVASPATTGSTTRVCNHNPGWLGNNGGHFGIANQCVAI